MFDTDQLCDMGRRLAGVDTCSYSDSDLLAAAVGLTELASHVATAQAHVLAELDARGVTDRAHGMKTVSWLAREGHCSRAAIRARLRVGRSLRHHFTEVDEAVRDGRLSFDHAKALSDADNPRITAVLAAAQDEIITLAESASFEQWKRDLAALAAYADVDGTEPDPYAGNQLQMSKTLDGRVEVRGSLDAARGLAFTTAVDAMADQLFRRFTRDRSCSPDLEIPDRRTLRALALSELLRTAMGAEPGSGTAPRAEVTLVVHDHETTDADGIPLPQAAAGVWGCDPDVWAVMVNRMGIPVDVGHANRLATIAQRRAIAIRDGGCTFPGCDAPIDWCDHHHVVDWHHGGPTDMANLVALCRHHHGVTHRVGWTMTLDDEQVAHWTSPSGDHLVGQRHHRRRDAAPPRIATPNWYAGQPSRPAFSGRHRVTVNRC